jgi:hypothetical protein
MAAFQSFTGVITLIDDFWVINGRKSGCIKLMSVVNKAGRLVNFVVMPNTYFIDHAMVNEGDTVTGFYDASAPAPLIFPPQLQAIVMVKATLKQNVKVDYFNSQLVSGDGQLKLNIAPSTQIWLENGQRFRSNPANRDLIVVYGATTRSIPAQTTPYQIIVMCTNVK